MTMKTLKIILQSAAAIGMAFAAYSSRESGTTMAIYLVGAMVWSANVGFDLCSSISDD